MNLIGRWRICRRTLRVRSDVARLVADLCVLGHGVSGDRCLLVLFFLVVLNLSFLHAQETQKPSKNVDQPLDSFLYAPMVPKTIDLWKSYAPERFEGIIKEIDDKSIRFDDGKKTQEMPSDRVMSLQPAWRTEEASKAHALFARHQFREALEAFQPAINSKLPDWQKGVLFAEIIETYVALGDWREAGNIFVSYLSPKFKPHALQYAYLPANWTTTEPDEKMRTAAAKWLADESESAQLLGASWLLLGSDNKAAQSKIAQLQKSKVAPIAALAVAQSWRLTAPPTTMERYGAWSEFRDRMLPPLQIGPTEFLADRLSRIGQLELAIGQWSRIASMHGDRYHRSTLALNAMLQQLRQANRTEESKRLEAWIEQLQAGK
jgi:tetratricopeptide (TPR) repeat protein